MVGVPRSSRCNTCRERKIKCDEKWPVCGQCRRSHRDCPGPTTRTFVDSGAKLREAMPTPSRNEIESIRQIYGSLVPVRSQALGSGSIHKLRMRVDKNKASKSPSESPPGGDEPQYQMTQPLPHSASENISFAFSSLLSLEDPRYNISSLGSFIWHIPQRFGTSEALDAVGACIIDAHAAVLRNDDPTRRMNPILCKKALHSVQKALDSPIECYSASTICAIILLQRLEAVFSPNPQNNPMVHASGVSRLIQLKGPPQLSDDIAYFMVTVDCHVSIIQHALSLEQDCYLASPEWVATLEVPHGRTNAQMLFYSIVKQMTLWPTMIRLHRLYYRGQLPDVSQLSGIAQGVSEKLAEIGEKLNILIENGDSVWIKPSATGDQLVPFVFDFADYITATVFVYHAMMSIIVTTMLQSILSPDITNIKAQNFPHGNRLWMMVEYGRSRMPFGFPVLTASLVISFEAAPPELEQWIIEAINYLNSLRELEDGPWFREKIVLFNQIATGRAAYYGHDAPT